MAGLLTPLHPSGTFPAQLYAPVVYQPFVSVTVEVTVPDSHRIPYYPHVHIIWITDPEIHADRVPIVIKNSLLTLLNYFLQYHTIFTNARCTHIYKTYIL